MENKTILGGLAALILSIGLGCSKNDLESAQERTYLAEISKLYHCNAVEYVSPASWYGKDIDCDGQKDPYVITEKGKIIQLSERK